MKISVILPTNKIHTKIALDKMKEVCKVKKQSSREDTIFNWDFTGPLEDYVCDAEHILEPTIDCLFGQASKDIADNEYEVLLCHKHPEDVKELVKGYSNNFDIKVIEEKPSIWHELGNQYRTVNNIRNTGLIHAKGELILFLDDYTIFGPYLLQRAWEEYKKGYYITARGMRRIRYNPDAKSTETPTRKTLVDKGVSSSYNFNNINEGDIIPNSATWTYCCSVSLKDCLAVNGFDEIYDGNFGGTDQDFGRRIAKASNMKRKLVYNIYEFAHKSPRQRIRDDEKMRIVFGQSPNPKYIIANSWKPTKYDRKRYRLWHKQYFGVLDPNWDAFMNVPLFNIKELRMIEEL